MAPFCPVSVLSGERAIRERLTARERRLTATAVALLTSRPHPGSHPERPDDIASGLRAENADTGHESGSAEEKPTVVKRDQP
jgi:hypothetical protein